MNVCEAVTSLLIIKWLARSLLFASRIRATPFTHAFHHPYEVADTFIYTHLYTLSLYIISSFTYSLREFDATRRSLDRRFPPTFSQTFNVSPLLKLREYFKQVSSSVKMSKFQIFSRALV